MNYFKVFFKGLFLSRSPSLYTRITGIYAVVVTSENGGLDGVSNPTMVCSIPGSVHYKAGWF